MLCVSCLSPSGRAGLNTNERVDQDSSGKEGKMSPKNFRWWVGGGGGGGVVAVEWQ